MQRVRVTGGTWLFGGDEVSVELEVINESDEGVERHTVTVNVTGGQALRCGLGHGGFSNPHAPNPCPLGVEKYADVLPANLSGQHFRLLLAFGSLRPHRNRMDGRFLSTGLPAIVLEELADMGADAGGPS